MLSNLDPNVTLDALDFLATQFRGSSGVETNHFKGILWNIMGMLWNINPQNSKASRVLGLGKQRMHHPQTQRLKPTRQLINKVLLCATSDGVAVQ